MLHAGGAGIKDSEEIPLSQILVAGDELRQSNKLAETSLAGGLVGAGLGLLLSVVVALSVWLVMGHPAVSPAFDWVLLSTPLITTAAPAHLKICRTSSTASIA